MRIVEFLFVASILFAATVAIAAPNGTADDDKLIPADSTGPLLPFKGRPWIKALGFCGGLHEERNLFLKPTDAKAAQAARMKAAPFLANIVTRVKRDRGIDNDAAFKVGLGEINKGRLIAQTTLDAQIEDAFKLQDLNCTAILKAADALKD